MGRIVNIASIALLSLAAFLAANMPGHVRAEEACLTGCHDHEAVLKGAVVHKANEKGCPICHSGTDGSRKPHKNTGNFAKGLAAEPPELCFKCHDKAEFSRKNVHDPVAKGKCLSCHNPHASEEPALLKKKPALSCLACHAKIRKSPHPLSGGHFLGTTRKGQKEVKDPLREGKSFYCGSCHNPHSSDNPKLFRYKANEAFELCVYCHKEV